MKRLLSLLLLLTAFFVGLSSCSSNDDEPDVDVRVYLPGGTWECTAIKTSGAWIDITKEPYASRLGFAASFDKDGTCYAVGALGTGRAKYAIKGRSIEIYVDGEMYLKCDVRMIVGNTAEMILKQGDSSVEIKLHRIDISIKP
mgnify:CR=1 FL=1